MGDKENKHHIDGPSSLGRREACPYSRTAEQGLSEETSPDAEEGTFLHECVALNKLDGLTTEQSSAVQSCIDFRESIKASSEVIEAHSEFKLRAVGSDFEELYTGTADEVVVTETGISIIDWKFGRIKVEYAPDNIQMAGYALPAMQMFGKDSCTVHIHQPRINASSSYTFTNAMALLKYIEAVIARCKQPNAPRISGAKQCKYCKARHICPELIKEGNAIVAVQKSIYEITDPNVLCDLYRKSKIVSSALKSVDKRVRDFMLENNGECGELIFKIKKGNREVTSIPDAFLIMKEYGISQEEFLGCCSTSVSNLLELFSKKQKANGSSSTLKELESQFMNVMSDVIQYGADRKEIKDIGE
jgi:hypothetical protein